MLTCDNAADLWLDFLERNLSPELQDAVSQHLQRCKPCERVLVNYRKTTVLCKMVLMKKPPPGVGVRLLDFLRRETQGFVKK